MPSSASPPASAAMKRSTLSISARPSRSRTVSASICVDAARDHLVEHRLGVAHAASGASCDELERLIGDRSALRLHDAARACRRSSRSGSGRKVKRWSRDTTAGRMPAGIGRAEDEQDVGRRLLERLEEDVPALLDALDLVDDEDLLAQVGGRGVDARQQLAHVVDAVVRCGVELDDVQRAAVADRHAATRTCRQARRRQR